MSLTILCKLLRFIEFQFDVSPLCKNTFYITTEIFSGVDAWDMSYLCLKGFRMSTYVYTQSKKNLLKSNKVVLVMLNKVHI